MSYNLPNPSLVGTLLVISTHNGPQVAFSYPENLASRHLKSHMEHTNPNSEDEDFDDEDYEAADSNEADLLFTGESSNSPSELGQSQVLDASHPNYYLGTKYDLMTFLDARESQRAAASAAANAPESKIAARRSVSGGLFPQNATDNHVSNGPNVKPQTSKQTPNKPGQILGFEPDQLSEMLCPPRAMCNRRFDVMLENVVFLGLPIHVDLDGSWRAKKKTHKAGTASRSERRASRDEAEAPQAPDPESDTSHGASAMSMFHLVFVMSPPDIERNYRVDEMFYNVTSKLSLVLRYEQQKHDYVWQQTREISRLKDQYRTSEDLRAETSMASHLVAQSALCQMMAECYTAISASQIANLNVNGKPRSFQIPLKMEFHSLPEPTVPYIPGSSLSSTINCLGSAGLVNIGETTRYSNRNFTESLLGLSSGSLERDTTNAFRNGSGSANNNEDDDDDNVSSNPDDIVHLALLLWDDADVIIKDIKAETHSAIARFVRKIKPTESLLKIANTLHLQAGTSAHLSLAEIKSFALHLVYWRRARVIPPLNSRAIYIVSPMAPIATNFHKDIVRFSQQFPTVPSLPSFLRLLSARSRKPRQFASIIPSRDHKDMYLLALAWLVRYGYVTQLHTYIWLKVPKKVKMKVEEELEQELGKTSKRSADDLRLKRLRAGHNDANLTVDNSSKQVGTSAKETSPRPEDLVDEEIDRLQKRLEASTSIPDLVLEDDGDTILVDPGRASTLERRWINKIIHDECGLSSELTAVFYKLLKYMNGKNSLELLLLRENVSRSELRKLLSEIDDYIISVRHW